MIWVPTICLALSVLVAGIAAYSDFRTGTIPNELTYPAIVLGVALQALAGYGHIQGIGFGGGNALWGVAQSLLGAALSALPYWVFFRMKLTRGDGSEQRVGYGGDVKVFAALGALLGYYHGLEATFFSTCVAGLLGMARLAWNGRLLSALVNSFFLPLNPVLPRRWRREVRPELLNTIRMGAPIFLGTAASAALRVQPML